MRNLHQMALVRVILQPFYNPSVIMIASTPLVLLLLRSISLSYSQFMIMAH